MYDVAIAGGGPVGLGLALELGRRDISVAVVEPRTTPQSIPKGQNLTQRTMEHMQAWGVEDAIRNAKTIPKGVGLGGLTAYGSLLSGYHYDWFKRASVNEYYYAENERLPQYATEAVLRSRVAELNSVDVFYERKVTDADQSDDAVSATIVECGSGNRHGLKARYLVGCDGSHSTVRRLAGISETRTDHDRLMVLVVFRSPQFFDLVSDFKDKQFFNVLHPDLDGYWMFFGMVEWGQSLFFHAPVPHQSDQEKFDFAGLIRQAVGADIDLDLDHIGFWDLRISQANAYSSGRIFIAGDAAHSHPPYGGYGINTGFEDARNLGWKLAADLHGWAGPSLLDSYDAERRPVFASTASDFIEHFIEDDRAFVRRYNPAIDREEFEAAWTGRAANGAGSGIAGYAPHYSGSPITVGGDARPPSAVGDHSHRAVAGRHLPPFQLSDGRKVQECLGNGFTYLSLNGNEAGASAFAKTAQHLEVPLTTMVLDDEAAHRSYGCDSILVRPDNFIAWTGSARGYPERILRQACGWN